jgi:predicted amidohydrolase YtcJ
MTTFALLGTVRPDLGSAAARDGLLVVDGRVRGYGREARAAAERGDVPVRRLPDGWVAQPAFRDPHLHLLGMAAARLSVDCRAEAASDLPGLLGLLADAAEREPPEHWLRGFGFDDALLAERRPPTADELDAAVPLHPLVLRHRTGHVALLNSAAARALGRWSAGDPVAAEELPDRLPGMAPEALGEAVAAVSDTLARAGVVAVGDATAANDRARLDTIAGLAERGALKQEVVFMPGVDELARLRADGLGFGARHHGVAIGHAKVMPPATPGAAAEVAAAVREARAHGWSVAIHALDPAEIDAALAALAAVEPAAAPDRIEHAGLCLPGQHDQLRCAGVTVVSNPAFLAARGRKYSHELTAVEREWLYPVRSLLDRGVPVAFASDAPVVDPAPLASVAAAVRRGDGLVAHAPAEAVAADEALPSVTHAAALAMGLGDGRLAPGADADLVVLDADPLTTPNDEIAAIGVMATLRGGAELFAAGELEEPRAHRPVAVAAR